MRPVRFDEELRQRLRVNLDGFEVQSADRGELVDAAVCVAIVGGDDGEASFVLIQRASSSGDHRGQFALPGGRVDAGETRASAAGQSPVRAYPGERAAGDPDPGP